MKRKQRMVDFRLALLLFVCCSGWLNSSVFAAAPVTTGLKLHLDASALNLSNNAEVTAWTDLSGNGNNATSTQAPNYITNVINGKPTVHFSGTDWMDLSNNIVSLGAVNAFVVARMTGNGYCLGSYSSGRFYLSRDSSGFRYRVGDGFSYGQTADDNFHIFQISHIGTAVEVRKDGVLVATGSDSKTVPIPGFNLGSYNDGSGDYMRGDIAEVLVYNRALTDSEQTATREYLSDKYGINVFQPLPVTSGLKLWLDADAIINAASNGYLVNTWYDLSGYNNHAVALFPPRYVSQVLNGKPTVQFSGESWMNLPDGLVSLGAVNAFVVARMTGNGYCLGSYSSGRFYLSRDSNGFRYMVGDGFSYGQTADDNFHIFQISHIGTAVEVRKDGVLVATGSDSKTVPIPGFNLGSYNDGAGQFMFGDIAKVLIYNRALTGNEQELVQVYLSKQYGLSSSFSRVQFTSATSSGNESASSPALQVTLSQTSSSPVTVNYSVTGGVATGDGVDYTLNAGSLTFAPGETEKIINISIVDDSAWEVNETIEVTLTNASGTDAALGTCNRHTYSIINNDTFYPASFSSARYLTAVRNYADSMIQYARDHYGAISSPLFASTLDLSTMAIPTYALPTIEGIRETDRMPTGDNTAHHQELWELFYLLTTYYSDVRYAQATDAALGYFFTNCQSPVTDLLAWGEHLGWDFLTEQRTIQHSVYGTHEFFDVWRLWDRSYQLALQPCSDFALGLWNHQIYDQTSCTFSRHASYDAHGPSQGAEYPRHGGFIIHTWANAYAHSTDPTFRATMLLAIERLVDSYENRRTDPNGGYVGNIPPGGLPVGSSSPYSTQWWSGSELGLAIDATNASPMLPAYLQQKIAAMTAKTDQVYLTYAGNPGGVWAQGYGSEATYMLCLERYQQTGNTAYRTKFMYEADKYLTQGPDLSKPLFPGAFADAIEALIEAYQLTGNQQYKTRADYYGQMALQVFFVSSSALPQATSQHPQFYEAITGGDNLMLQLFRLATTP